MNFIVILRCFIMCFRVFLKILLSHTWCILQYLHNTLWNVHRMILVLHLVYIQCSMMYFRLFTQHPWDIISCSLCCPCSIYGIFPRYFSRLRDFFIFAFYFLYILFSILFWLFILFYFVFFFISWHLLDVPLCFFNICMNYFDIILYNYSHSI